MRLRVASTAAFVSLCCCLIFAMIYNRTARGSLLNDQVIDLQRLCRVSADYADAAALSTSESGAFDAMMDTGNRQGVGFAAYETDGTLIASNRYYVTSANAAEQSDFIDALGGDQSVTRQTIRNRVYLYTSAETENGLILRLCEQRIDPTTLTRKVAGLLILFAIGLSGLCFVVVMLLARSSDRFSDSTRYILEAFAEGRFDARLTGVHGAHARWAEQINGFADRIQKQINHQSTRNQALSVVMNQMQNGMLAVNSDLNVILMTPVARSLFGVHEPPEGKPVAQMSKDVNLETIFRESIGQPGVYVKDVAVHEGTTGRSLTPLKLYISPMIQDDKTVGAIAMIEDITEIRRLEQVRNDFTANVSHELKTPLTSIRGFVETLLDGAIEKPDMARKFLNIIMMETNRLSRLVNDILSISKLESGDTEVSNERLQLDRMADNVCEVLKLHAKDRKVDLSINEQSGPIYVWGNSDRLEQLLMNLIENAIKYNKEGGSVRVSVTASKENANVLVSDTGIGIAEEHLPHLFERFYRVDKGRSRAMGGTGLGLAIVKHIAVSMGGTIEVHSKLGVGSEFLVTLPRYYPSDTEMATDEEDDI